MPFQELTPCLKNSHLVSRCHIPNLKTVHCQDPTPHLEAPDPTLGPHFKTLHPILDTTPHLKSSYPVSRSYIQSQSSIPSQYPIPSQDLILEPYLILELHILSQIPSLTLRTFILFQDSTLHQDPTIISLDPTSYLMACLKTLHSFSKPHITSQDTPPNILRPHSPSQDTTSRGFSLLPQVSSPRYTGTVICQQDHPSLSLCLPHPRPPPNPVTVP